MGCRLESFVASASRCSASLSNVLGHHFRVYGFRGLGFRV